MRYVSDGESSHELADIGGCNEVNFCQATLILQQSACHSFQSAYCLINLFTQVPASIRKAGNAFVPNILFPFQLYNPTLSSSSLSGIN